VPNFIGLALRGAYPKICEILRFCDFLLSCPGYTFFSQSCPGRTPGRILTVYGLNDTFSPKDVPFGALMTHNFKGFKHPKTHKNGAWLLVRHFSAKVAKS